MRDHEHDLVPHPLHYCILADSEGEDCNRREGKRTLARTSQSASQENDDLLAGAADTRSVAANPSDGTAGDGFESFAALTEDVCTERW